MKKRTYFLGTIVVLLVYAVVATTVWAVFSPKGEVSGLTFRSVNQSIKLSADQSANPSTASFGESVMFSGAQNMYPGMVPVSEKLWIFNDSETGQTMRLGASLSPGDQDWESLKYAVQLQVGVPSDPTDYGWYTLGELSEWQYPSLPFEHIGPGEKRQVELRYRMPTAYPLDPDGSGPMTLGTPIGNEAMGKTTAGAALIISAEVETEAI